ncbi:uncharacterized protein [Procambarus clarkii]|uniref:uncharacterized protein n=1 Tax=Procambarus clarkii TaxID=6728 RepID=UPI001E67033C|nr:uncharacterized protein LOC123756666 [Procambarus clarkii]
MECNQKAAFQQPSLTLDLDITPGPHDANISQAAHFSLFGAYVNPSTVLLFLSGNFLCLLVAYFLLTIYRTVRGHQQSDSDKTELRTISARPGEWVRPVSNLEIFSAAGAAFGKCNTAQVLWLSSAQAISPQDVKRALSIIARKIHVLQLCLAWRWLRPWLRRMEDFVVDFDVDTGDAMTVYCHQIQAPYNYSQGPLWRARLVPLPQPSPDRHEAVLVLTLHHVITDGFTNMTISRDLLEVLNAIMTGQEHNTPTRPIIPAIGDELVSRKDWIYCLRLLMSTTYQVIANMFNGKCFNISLPQPTSKLALLKVLREDFSKETTQQLLHHCKEAKVSIHSTIMAAAYLALLRTAQEHSKEKLDALTITYDNAVNMRRYYPSVYQESPGCHSSMCKQEYVVRSSDAASKRSFWALARRMHDDLHHSLIVSKAPIWSGVLGWALAAIQPFNYVLTRLGYKNLINTNMTCTNMGNLKTLLPGKYGDGPVEITSLLRSTASELVGTPFLVVFQSFEGRLLMSLDYYINNITEENAKMFFSFLTHYIANVARYGSINTDNCYTNTTFHSVQKLDKHLQRILNQPD